jgi:hypothetical protein
VLAGMTTVAWQQVRVRCYGQTRPKSRLASGEFQLPPMLGAAAVAAGWCLRTSPALGMAANL